jgi:hypothetical protein
LYVDGAVRASGSAIGSLAANSDDLWVGRARDGWSSSYANATLDEIAIYNTALTPARVAAHRYTGLASMYKGSVDADLPVAYWRLGESSGTTASDAVGSNNGTYVNGVSLGQTGALSGDANTAALFDGTNDYMTVPDAATLDLTSAVSVEFWVKPTGTGDWRFLVGKATVGDGAYANYQVLLDPDNKLNVSFGNISSELSLADPVALDTGWHHVVATYSTSAGGVLYVDGAVRASGSAIGSLAANSDDLWVGRARDGWSSSYARACAFFCVSVGG